MKTTLFNLYELQTKSGTVIIEFYAGDIFDSTSDILLLSAYKGMFFPKTGTIWGSLYSKTNISVFEYDLTNSHRFSENVLSFNTRENPYFIKLVALELSDLNRKYNFTSAKLASRYQELLHFLENFPAETDESISLPLLGTGNQGISLEESVSHLLKSFNQLKNTKLKIIRVFAYNFETIGVLNKKINEFLSRNEVIQTNLFKAVINESCNSVTSQISDLSLSTLNNINSLANSEHSSLQLLGLIGRRFAELVCNKLLDIYQIDLEPSTLSSKISALSQSLRQERPIIETHLRLLQIYSNQVAHAGNPDLNQQDGASIILSILRIIDFYEYKINN